MRTAGPIIVIFDNDCALCRAQMCWLQRLDWRHVLNPMPMADVRVAECAPGVARADLERAIHCVAADGRVFRGARCVRHLAMRLPLLIPLALVLWIPGSNWLAEQIYRRVSRHRQQLSRPFVREDHSTGAPGSDTPER